MRYSPALLQSLEGSFRHLKTPLIDAPAAQRDPAVIETVSAMLSDIQQPWPRRRAGLRSQARQLPGRRHRAQRGADRDQRRPPARRPPRGDRARLGAHQGLRRRAARAPHRLRDRARPGSHHRSPLHPGLARGRLPPGGALPADGERVHDRRRRQGRGRSHRHRLHPAPAARRRQRRRRLRRPPLRRRPGLRPRRRAGARRDGVRPARRTADRHARRRRQRLSSPRRSASSSAPSRSTCSPAPPRSR